MYDTTSVNIAKTVPLEKRKTNRAMLGEEVEQPDGQSKKDSTASTSTDGKQLAAAAAAATVAAADEDDDFEKAKQEARFSFLSVVGTCHLCFS